MKTIEQLKADLAAGTITLAEFKTQAKAVLAADLASKAIDQAAHDSKLAEVEATPDPKAGGGGGGLTAEDVKKLIQSETDKVRTEYSNKLKESQEALDQLRREKMTEEEKAAEDLKKTQDQLAKREADLLKREVDLHAVDAINKKSLPLNFREFLVGSSVEETDKRIESFSTAWATAIKAEVEKRFKESGEDHNKGGGAGGTDNPFKPETLNLTKQGELIKGNPTLAKQLAAAAGVTLDI